MSAAASKTTTKTLMNYLAAPSRVASKMDWKRQSANILAVDIGPDRIGLAVAPHPSCDQPIQTLEPLTHETTLVNNRRVLSETCVTTLASIVQHHRVCALVVSWPVQHEGRCGKPCGQVLHALDSLVQQSNTIVTKNRPVCLWDDRHTRAPPADTFGRDPTFGNAPSKTKTIHRASQEQYQHHVCSSAVAAQVWKDFCQTHWPQIENIENDVVDFQEEDRIEEYEEGLEVEKESQEQLKVAFAA